MQRIKKNKGFTLIEIIISMGILSTIILTILGLKILSVKNSLDSGLRTNGVSAAQSFMEWFKLINPPVEDSVTYYIFYKTGSRLSKYPDRDYIKYDGVTWKGFYDIKNIVHIKNSGDYDYIVRVVLLNEKEVTVIHVTSWSRLAGEDSKVQMVSLRGRA